MRIISKIKRIFGIYNYTSCDGCWEEFHYALELQQKGYYIATTTNDPFWGKRHLIMRVVDNDGNVYGKQIE